MKRLRELLRFDGRLSRLGYWRGYLRLAVVGVLTVAVALFAILGFGHWGAVFLLPVLPVVVASVAIVVRRLHDRNRSGWWFLAYGLVPLVLGLWLRQGHPAGITVAILLAVVLGWGFNIWGFIEIGCRRGTRGPNRFGDEPAVGS